MAHGDVERLMKEYFPDCTVEKVSETKSRMILEVPAKERLWKAFLLSFGDKVTVVGPEEYKRELTYEVHAMVHLAEISGMTEKI